MCAAHVSTLPTPAPEDPLPLVEQWVDEAARAGLRNHDAMALATVAANGQPSVRMVLMRGLSVKDGFAVFYTHYGSRKARELEHNGRAAGVIYWETLCRQVRFEGRVVRSPAAESDRYFASRAFGSQLNAWTSEQSAPLADAGDLQRRAESRTRELSPGRSPGTGKLPRPPYWGGYRLWFHAVELWVEGVDRFHQRLRYERLLTPLDEVSFSAGAWRSERLQP